MDELVYRDEAKMAIEKLHDELVRERAYEESQGAVDAMHVVLRLPAVDAAPVVHGRWIYKERHRKSYRQYTGFDDAGETHTIMVLEESDGKEPYCSECGAQAAESFLDYCPRCGAKMDGDKEDVK